MEGPVPVAVAMHVGAALDTARWPTTRVADVEELIGIGKGVHAAPEIGEQ